MAGTFAEQAELATSNAFIAKVKCAMIFRANELLSSSTAQNWKTLDQMRGIFMTAASQAPTIAALVASANATIAAAAPAVPSDGDTQFAVNVILSDLLE